MPIYSLVLVGTAQIVGIGALFFGYPVLVTAIGLELGYPASWLFGCLTASILIGGLPSPWIGRLIDRHGAYRVVVGGSVLGAVSLVGLGASTGLVSLTLSLLAIQIASNMTLYEAMFPALMQIDQGRARRLISQLTLFGGFSSTVFWPLTQFMLEQIGWRATLFAFAAANLFFVAPVYTFALRNAKPIVFARSRSAPVDQPLVRPGRRSMMLMTAAICLVSFSQQAVVYDFVPALIAHGMDAATVATVGALLGPSSVIARMLDIALGQRVHPLASTIGTMLLLSASLFVPAIVPAGSYPGLILFVILFGVAQGIFAILRGTLPLALFGPVGYGARLGIVYAFRRYAVATSPFLFAFAVEQVGAKTAFALLALISLAGLGLLCLVRK